MSKLVAECVPTHSANFTQVCVRLLVETDMAAKFYSNVNDYLGSSVNVDV